MTRALSLVVVLAWLAAAAPAAAVHQVYYRYVVLGFVKDARGAPLAGRRVRLVREKTGFSYLAETDAMGFYLIVARLGDESVGETLTLTIDGTRRGLVARFDPTNHTDERGTRVDLEGVTFVERAAWFPSTLAQALGR